MYYSLLIDLVATEVPNKMKVSASKGHTSYKTNTPPVVVEKKW